MSRGPALAALLLTVALAACGGSEPEPEPQPPPPSRETVHELPKLPDGWRSYVNRRGGFAVGVPRGWKPRDEGDGALIRSFDRLVAVSIVPDRGADALAVGVEEFATRAAEALPGFRDELRMGEPRRFRHRYEAAEVRARGTAKGGVEQRISVIVLRRGRVATFTAVIAANAKPAAALSRKLAVRMVETLRSRPPRGDQRSGRSG